MILPPKNGRCLCQIARGRLYIAVTLYLSSKTDELSYHWTMNNPP